MEIRKNSERPAEGRNKDLGCHHLQNTVGFEQTRVRAKAGLNRRCRPPSPRMAPYIEGLPRGPKDPLQALPHPATRLVPHTSRRNGLRLLRLVEGDRKGGGGGRGRARPLLHRDVDTRVHHAYGVGMRATFPATPLCESGPLAKCPLQGVL